LDVKIDRIPVRRRCAALLTAAAIDVAIPSAVVSSLSIADEIAPYTASEDDLVAAATRGRTVRSQSSLAAERPVRSATQRLVTPSRSSATAAPPHARTPAMRSTSKAT
jgi:hypothetical protein